MTAIQLTPAPHAIRKPIGQNPAPRGDFREEKRPGDDSGPCWMVERYNDHELEHDHYTQPGDLFRLMSAQQRQLLIDNLVGALRGVMREGIVRRMLDHFRKVPPSPWGRRLG